jgi:ATP-dependent DNA helicase RecG
MPHAGLLGTDHYPDGREEPKDFDGPQVLAPEQTLQWLRDKLPDPVDRTEARRRPANEALFELAREGIVNALVHRDYGIEGAKCQLIATADTITVKSPGQPPAPITLEQLQSLTAPMLSRNPVLHYVFSQMELAEERGLGLKSMKRRSDEAGLPMPSYKWEDPYLVLTLFRNAESVSLTLKPEVAEALSADEKRGWELLRSRKTTSQKMYRLSLDVASRVAQRHLKKFVDLGLVRRVGSGPATVYETLPQ